MNKHLNNWLDKMDGLPEETSNNNIRKEIIRQTGKCDGKHQNVQEIINCADCSSDIDKLSAQNLGKRGGEQSAKSRFSGKSKAEISEIMRKVRYSKSEIKELDDMADEMVDSLNRSQKS